MNKRKHNSDDATTQWTLNDVIVPLADYGQTKTSIDHARNRFQTVVFAMLSCAAPRHVVLHYLQAAAREVEVELRNRPSARLGSLYFDLSVPVELDGEIERRMNVYIEKAEERDCSELLRVLNVYQAMSEILAGRSSPDCSQMLDECQALFFCIVHMSRDLQALLFAREHRSRLPQHLPMTRAEGLRFMEVLRLLTPLYTGERISSCKYVTRLRNFVFLGSFDVEGVSDNEGGVDEVDDNDNDD